MSEWQPITTAPRDGTYILVAGPSGYNTTPLRGEICCFADDCPPDRPWCSPSGYNFEDDGPPATLWLPLPGASPSG